MSELKPGDRVELLSTGVYYTVQRVYVVDWGALGTEDWALLTAGDGQTARWKLCQLRIVIVPDTPF